MHQALLGATFHLEHILPRSQGGKSTVENLALACPQCNLRKSDQVQAIDPISGENASLFHPRLDRWSDHFVWDGYLIQGLTSIGRATIAMLELNHPRRIQIRRAETLFGLFPHH